MEPLSKGTDGRNIMRWNVSRFEQTLGARKNQKWQPCWMPDFFFHLEAEWEPWPGTQMWQVQTVQTF